MSVRTRFAPSPTGDLHIGGARTAIFNWLFARHHGGQFVLRIDDTDQARHQEETIRPILDGFRWLGINWDEGPEIGGPHEPYFQSQRTETYQLWIDRLVATNSIYRDYSTAAERDRDTKTAAAEKRPYRFREKIYTTEQIAEFEKHQCPYCIRFRVVPGRQLKLLDLIRGEVVWNTDDISDFVIARMDGTPLYAFATTVDDAMMSISHVIRSEEHLANTFPQLLLYEAMGFAPPQFAHVPYVAATGSKKKLSKRDGGSGLQAYTDNYLPDAMLNYLTKLGWSLDDHTEILSRQQLIENFSLERVVHAPASHDPDKLYWIQSEWMKNLPEADKCQLVLEPLFNAGLVQQQIDSMPSSEDRELILKVIQALGDRLKVAEDIVKYGAFFFRPEVEYNEQAVAKRLLQDSNVKTILVDLGALLPLSRDTWNKANLEKIFHDYGEVNGFAMGLVVNAARVAITGVGVGPGLYDTLEIIGCDQSVARLMNAYHRFCTS